MTIREQLARTQRVFVATVFLAWLAAFLLGFTARPQIAFLAWCAAIAVVLGAFVYLFNSARCPRCAKRLWLLLYKLVPLGPFSSQLNHCPSCGVAVNEPAEA